MNLTIDGAPTTTDPTHDLAAVRRALLEDAHAEAKQIVAEARSDADRLIRQAVDDVDAEVERERHRSELSADAYSNRVLARARNDAKGEILRKQEALRRQLVDEVRASVLEISGDQRYSTLLDRLEAMARGQLGQSAVIERDRHPAGGVVAIDGTRRVDYTLRAIADRTLDAMSDEVVQLWS